jgi:hypothetical protein
LDVSPPKVWNKWGGGGGGILKKKFLVKIDNKKVMETLFGDSQNLTSSGKPCVRPVKKMPYKVYIFCIL